MQREGGRMRRSRRNVAAVGLAGLIGLLLLGTALHSRGTTAPGLSSRRAPHPPSPSTRATTASSPSSAPRDTAISSCSTARGGRCYGPRLSARPHATSPSPSPRAASSWPIGWTIRSAYSMRAQASCCARSRSTPCRYTARNRWPSMQPPGASSSPPAGAARWWAETRSGR